MSKETQDPASAADAEEGTVTDASQDKLAMYVLPNSLCNLSETATWL